jgi:minor extracellular serine protease Vpr
MPNELLKHPAPHTSLNTAFERVNCALRSILILSIFLLIATNCKAQENKTESKIDPAFQLLIKEHPEAKEISRKRCFLKKKGKVSTATNSGVNAVKYDCIVYTKNAQGLRNKGITINSVLPTFVTAKASLQQIQQMALMAEVSYIASPGMNSVEQKNR